MSYSIIFETKIVKLSDGRIIHFDRSGCNNDDAGRKKNEFTAEIYSIDDFMNKVEGFKENSKPIKECDIWELKINSRCATLYDYGEHLHRMFKRAISYDDLINNFYFSAEYVTGIELVKPEHKIMALEEFGQSFHDLLNKCGNLRYRRMIEYPDVRNEKEIVKLIEEGKPVEFEIRKRM